MHRRHYRAPDGWHDVAVMERFLEHAAVKTVVILQPQFFPWRGVFEQIRLADEFVHLDDAQFQKGGFTNRVQLKTANGPLWLTVPVLRHGKLPPIAEVEIDYKTPTGARSTCARSR